METPEPLTVSSLTSDAYAYLVQIQYWSRKYNEVAALLGDAGYHQAGQINDKGATVWFGCWDVGLIDQTPDGFLEWMALGPQPLNRAVAPSPSDARADAQKRDTRAANRKRCAELGERASWICIYCQLRGDEYMGPDGRAWHIDHLFPQSKGGDSMEDNLVIACATCNIKKSAKLASEILAGIKAKMGLL